jgi:flagellin
LVKTGSTVVYEGKTLKAIIKDEKGTAAANTDKLKDYEDSNIITKNKAYDMIKDEIALASSVGATNTKAKTTTTATGNEKAGDNVIFSITKGTVDKKENMSFSLHVGADADGNNKINVDLSALTAAGLGIEGINVKDATGANATYAIDAIADAIAKVSTQRSALGAVQNRLEHTINNLDNVVENTTSAESQIRDTDMATEMVRYSNANILQQAGQAMLAQANQSNQGVLSLLG